MSTIDRRGATVSAADPPIGTNPNPDLAIKAPVRAATTGSITLSGLQTIDGVALSVGDRVLVKDQTDATTNGLYNVATGPWTRAIDANNNSQFAQGMQVRVASGAVNGGNVWTLAAANPIVLGTSLLTFASGTILSIGGANALSPPTQNTPVSATIAIGGSYADSGVGNIFQVASWIDNTGTRPAVAVFGQGRALGVNSRAWGGNFVSYAGAAGTFAQGAEIDFGVSNGVSFQKAYGLSINVGGNTAGGTGNDTAGIAFDQLGSTATMVDAIRFSNFAGGQPFTNSLIKTTGAVTPAYGIDFSSATFGTAAFKSSGFLVDPSGNITGATYNKVAITAPALSATLTIANNKTLTANNSITLAGTDGKTLTLTNSLTVNTNDGTLAFGTAAATITFQGTDTYVGRTTTDTLTNKTLTSPVIASISGNSGAAGTLSSGTNGGTGGQLTLNGATSGSAVLSVGASNSLLQLGSSNITADNVGTLTSVNVIAQNLQTSALNGLGAAVVSSTIVAVGAGTTAKSQINFASSTAPTSPNNGDFWFDGTNFKARVGGVTKTFTIT